MRQESVMSDSEQKYFGHGGVSRPRFLGDGVRFSEFLERKRISEECDKEEEPDRRKMGDGLF